MNYALIRKFLSDFDKTEYKPGTAKYLEAEKEYAIEHINYWCDGIADEYDDLSDDIGKRKAKKLVNQANAIRNKFLPRFQSVSNQKQFERIAEDFMNTIENFEAHLSKVVDDDDEDDYDREERREERRERAGEVAGAVGGAIGGGFLAVLKFIGKIILFPFKLIFQIFKWFFSTKLGKFIFALLVIAIVLLIVFIILVATDNWDKLIDWFSYISNTEALSLIGNLISK